MHDEPQASAVNCDVCQDDPFECAKTPGRHCDGWKDTRDEPQTAPVPDLLATTISCFDKEVVIACDSFTLRDEIYDWIMQAASSLSRPERP